MNNENLDFEQIAYAYWRKSSNAGVSDDNTEDKVEQIKRMLVDVAYNGKVSYEQYKERHIKNPLGIRNIDGIKTINGERIYYEKTVYTSDTTYKYRILKFKYCLYSVRYIPDEQDIINILHTKQYNPNALKKFRGQTQVKQGIKQYQLKHHLRSWIEHNVMRGGVIDVYKAAKCYSYIIQDYSKNSKKTTDGKTVISSSQLSRYLNENNLLDGFALGCYYGLYTWVPDTDEVILLNEKDALFILGLDKLLVSNPQKAIKRSGYGRFVKRKAKALIKKISSYCKKGIFITRSIILSYIKLLTSFTQKIITTCKRLSFILSPSRIQHIKNPYTPILNILYHKKLLPVTRKNPDVYIPSKTIQYHLLRLIENKMLNVFTTLASKGNMFFFAYVIS